MKRPKPILASPETPADAIVLLHAVIDERVTRRLKWQFGKRAVAATYDNLRAWMVHRVGESITATFTGNFAEVDFDKRVDETLPGDLAGALSEPPLTAVRPVPFDELQSAIVFTALRRAGGRPDFAEYLNRLTVVDPPFAPAAVPYPDALAAARPLATV